ncbi:MAG: Rho termination factor N-terminal domain-containing protein, partial [Polaribacter sp.]|nr:Rho termination factor N-terminal domain-containing protein [Polaribacter sp.]
DYSSMTDAQLKVAAKENGISGYTSLKKAELIEALTK